MNTISSSTSFSTKRSTNKGMSGLISGMDTEGMVESMLAGTQGKIDKQNGIKQQIEWKQEIYRSVISNINTFQSKYFDFTSKTNLMSAGFFNAMSAVSSSQAVKVSGTSSASAGKTTIQVGQLATNASIKSGSAVSGDLVGKIDQNQMSKIVVFNKAGEINPISINLDGKDNAGIAAALTVQGIDATVDDKGNLVIKSDAAITVSNQSTALGLSTLGLQAGATDVQADGKHYLFGKVDLNAKPTVDITLDGITKTITLQGSTEADVLKSLSDGITSAFGTSAIKVTNTSNLTLSTTEGRQIYVTGSSSGLAALGMVSGQSNKISTGLKLSELSFKTSLQGVKFTAADGVEYDYSFTINKKTFNFKADDTLSKVMDSINSSDAGVKITYSALEDKFNIEATNSGAGFSIKMEDTTGNLLGAMFGTTRTSNKIDSLSGEKTLGELGLDVRGIVDANGNPIVDEYGNPKVNEKTKLSELSSFSNGLISYDDIAKTITLTNTKSVSIKGTTDAGNNLMKELFGSISVNEAGQNAKVTINGVTTERSTNNFTVNGLNFELKETTGKYENGVFTGDTVTIDTTRNTDQIFDGIKSFVDDYNKMIKELNGYIDEEGSYKQYPPLTAAQKKEMSDKEIEAWEKKSKQGLIRNDGDVGGFLSDMRSSLYNRPEGSKFALYDIGIETSDSWREKGKLTIDEGKLKEMIQNEPEEVRKLFFNGELAKEKQLKLADKDYEMKIEKCGIAEQLSWFADSVANASSANPGTLVKLAGVVGRATETENILTKRMKDIADKVKDLNRKYETEKARYWRQFNDMEKIISNMNTQSSWLSQQLG